MYLNKKTFSVFILFITITGFAATFSQSVKQTRSVADIFIKSGERFPNAEIKEFLPWGFFIDSVKAINYKVISKITTKDKYIVDELSKNIDGLKVSLAESTYTIDLLNAETKYKWKPAPNAGKALNGMSLHFSSSPNKYGNVSIGAYFFPQFLPDFIYLNVNASGNYFSSVPDVYVRGAYGEIGCIVKADFLDLLCGFGFGTKSIQYSAASESKSVDGYPSYIDVAYIEVNVKFNFISKKVFAFIGFRDYLTSFVTQQDENNNALKFGLGLSF